MWVIQSRGLLLVLSTQCSAFAHGIAKHLLVDLSLEVVYAPSNVYSLSDRCRRVSKCYMRGPNIVDYDQAWILFLLTSAVSMNLERLDCGRVRLLFHEMTLSTAV